MSQLLPTGVFKWVDVKLEEVYELSKKEKYGYVLEVDVRYHKEIHDSHNDLPFMCEKMKIDRVEKLTSNLYGKRKYVIHMRAQMQALNHGLILEKVHREIDFEQSAWMKPYMAFNTQLRTQATNDFEKDFFKFMNNAIFGKTMENIRKHRNIKLVTDSEKYLKTVIKTNFKSSVLFGENLIGCEMGKIKVVMNKPVYLGQSILDLSKLVMHEFHYDYIPYRKKTFLKYIKTCF